MVLARPIAYGCSRETSGFFRSSIHDSAQARPSRGRIREGREGRTAKPPGYYSSDLMRKATLSHRRSHTGRRRTADRPVRRTRRARRTQPKDPAFREVPVPLPNSNRPRLRSRSSIGRASQRRAAAVGVANGERAQCSRIDGNLLVGRVRRLERDRAVREPRRQRAVVLRLVASVSSDTLFI